jgi:sugar lactone lactonase YvrE
MNKSRNKCVDAEKPAGSRVCLRNTRARLVFPVTTGVMHKKEKKTAKNNQPSRFTASSEAVTKIAEEQFLRPNGLAFSCEK